MKHLVTKTGAFIAGGLMILAMAAPAYGKDDLMRVDIPFAFFAGEQKLPAGEYRVRFDPTFRALDLMSMKEATICRVQVWEGQAARKLTDTTPGLLIFHLYGADYVLKRVFFRDATRSQDLRPSSTEIEFSRAAAPAVAGETAVGQLK